jgi:8-oxo-dGTP diphosphatase
MSYLYEFPRPALTADIVLMRKSNQQLEVLLIRRKNPPYQNQWALPGGFVDIDETTEEAARRELLEETGIDFDTLRQFRTYDALDRDPRQRTISVVYIGTYHAHGAEPTAADDAAEVRWFPVSNIPSLAFDHNQILADVLEN